MKSKGKSRLMLRSMILLIWVFPKAASTAPVHIWEPVEIALEAAEAPADPYAGAQVWVDLEGPGFSKRCYGFWDGDRKFRVRVQATASGVWTWRSGSHFDDAGLNGKRGTFETVPWTEAEKQVNPNRRGQVGIAANGRFFEYADRTPFFLLADTLWAGNTTRCGLGDHKDGPFFQYLADRREKGFTAILIQAIHGYGDYPNGQAHRNEGGYALLDCDPARLNPEYFQALDERMQAISDLGFVAAIPAMWWGKTKQCIFSPAEAQRISVYLAARYGTFNSLWCLSGEYQYTFRDCDWRPNDFNAMGAAVQRHNPWQHPLSIHPSGATNWAPPHNVQSSRPFHGESWLDHHWLQTGQSINRMCNIVTRLAENRALEPTVPIFCSESYYERASDSQSAYHSRWQVWTAYLNGAAGFGYGAQGLWQFFDPRDPKGEPGKMTRHPPVPWWEAIRLPGSAQVGHACKVLASLDWQTLEPCRDELRIDGKPNWQPTGKDLTPPHAARLGQSTWIVYVPRGNAKREISLPVNTARQAMRGRWYDPRTGVRTVATQGIHKSGRFPGRPVPSDEDWIFVLGLEDD